ncbi:putative Ig domain-containing protein, partial [Salmonella enterica]|uniref:putative Ig domain-containing protein n=1 Tax=Salmonella enterica TaxID=28901 RepID=UPI0032986BEC
PAITNGVLTAVTGIAANAGLADLLHLTGGTAPVTWGCTGLPAGLALDKSTGVVSGLVTAVAALPVPVSCTA